VKEFKSEVRLDCFKSLEIQVENVGCIEELSCKFKLEGAQFYVLAGSNGCGKSTFLAILGTLVMPSLLGYKYYYTEGSERARIVFSFEWKKEVYKEGVGDLDNPLIFEFPRDSNGKFGNWTKSGEVFFEKALGFYEPSVEVINIGMRGKGIGLRRPLLPREIDERKEKMKKAEYIPADKRFSEDMDYILTGKKEGKFSKYLKKTKGKLLDSHYILEFEDGKIVPQEMFSFGERCVLQMLRFVYSTLNPLSKGKRVLIIDELELGLHPKALERFLEFFLEKFEEVEQAGKEVFVIFSSHSPVVLNYVPLGNVIFMVNREGKCSIEIGSKAVDFVAPFVTSVGKKVYPIIVEDELSRKVIEQAISFLQMKGYKLPEFRRIPIIIGSGFPMVFKKALEVRQRGEFLPPKEKVNILVVIDGDIEEEQLRRHFDRHPEEKEKTEIMKLPPLEKYIVEKIEMVIGIFTGETSFKENLIEEIEEIMNTEEGEREKFKKAYRKLLKSLANYLQKGKTEVEKRLIDLYLNHLGEDFLESLKNYLQS